MLEGSGRLLAKGAAVVEAVVEVVNNNGSSAGGDRETLPPGATVLQGPIRLLTTGAAMQGPIAPVEASNSRRRRLALTSLAQTSVRRLLDSAWERRLLQLSQWFKRLTGIPKTYRR